jgi:predicted metal-dependent hydrolase
MNRIFKIYLGFKRKSRKIKKKKRVNKQYKENKEKARTIAIERLEYFNTFYNYKWGKIAIRNQKTRWGSCSRRGNLNFNYKIALLPARYSDYIIVHELCHLGEFNHSQNFWNLVARTIPDYKEIRGSLRRDGLRVS